eukprot:Colp12_sorted_trinity150504_noHs@33408
MGNLLQILKKDNKPATVDIFLDFENAQPKDAEMAVYNFVQEVLKKAPAILKDLEAYTGCGDQIRNAISNPSKESDEAAWNAVCPLVEKLKTFFEYSSELEGALPQLLRELCANDPIASLEAKQALAKQFAEILHFVLKFDDLKTTNPAIQNDFSYYRRTLIRMKMTNQDQLENVVVRDELANRMSLFYAYPTPMLKTLSDATAKFVSENPSVPVENITSSLCTMAQICQAMVLPEYSQRFQSQDTVLFCLRVMVGVIILYDHVHPVGAFSKKSVVDIKGAIKVLKEQPPAAVDGLLNALRYTTKHLNDEDTPKQVKQMLA